MYLHILAELKAPYSSTFSLHKSQHSLYLHSLGFCGRSVGVIVISSEFLT